MRVAVTFPDDHLFVGVLLHVVAEVLVRYPDHLVAFHRIDDLDGISRRTANIRLRLDLGRRVDVRDDLRIGMLSL
ncbi:hypothetical protein D9M71_831900 [compost metagenome]